MSGKWIRQKTVYTHSMRWMDGQADVGNFSPFYKTLSSIGAATLLPKANKEKQGKRIADHSILFVDWLIDWIKKWKFFLFNPFCTTLFDWMIDLLIYLLIYGSSDWLINLFVC